MGWFLSHKTDIVPDDEQNDGSILSPRGQAHGEADPESKDADVKWGRGMCLLILQYFRVPKFLVSGIGIKASHMQEVKFSYFLPCMPQGWHLCFFWSSYLALCRVYS